MFEYILGDSLLTIQQFRNQFKQFIVDNRLVGTAAGVTIGVTTKELIQSLVGDVVIPFFYLFAFWFGIEKIELLPGKTTFDITSFIRQLITWILSVIAIFFFVYYFFMSAIGINDESTTQSQSQPQSQPQIQPQSQIQTPIYPSVQPQQPNNKPIASYNNNVNNSYSYINTETQ